MRIRRPIALILSAALAAGALTGCSWEEFLEWLNSSSSQVVTDDPSTWPYKGNTLIAPEGLTVLPENIKKYINNDITALDLSKTQLQSIGSNAFKNCTSLKEIVLPDGLTTIDPGAFLLCENLQTVTLPSSVDEIGKYAFRNCTSLTSINLKDTGIKTIEYDTFASCTSLATVILPDGLTSIGDNAFYNCSTLKEIILPETLQTIETCAFWGCSSLKSITLPNSVGTIGSGAFWKCTSLTSINLKDTGITEILSDTFAGSTSLATVILPSKLTSIGYGAFQSCTGLTHLYFTSTDVPEIAENNTSSDNFTVGAFLGVDASKNNLTIYYPSTWNDTKIQELKDAIKESGMKSVDINNNVPKFESYTTLPTLSLLDAARLFGL